MIDTWLLNLRFSLIQQHDQLDFYSAFVSHDIASDSDLSQASDTTDSGVHVKPDGSYDSELTIGFH